MTLAIRTHALRKRFDDLTAVDGIDLEVKVGECFGLLGPNGAGKTTTIEIMEGLQSPTSGEVELLGMTWQKDEAALRERIGVALQETRLPDKLNVRETITLFRSFYKQGPSVDALLDLLQLREKEKTWAVKLSGGQRQRLGLACALASDPDVLFLDEPTTGLDPQSRRSIWDIVANLRARNKTVLLTTHYMDEAERLCDRIAIVDKGKVIALGTPRELIKRLAGALVIELQTEPECPIEVIAALPGIGAVRKEAHGLVVTVDELHTALPLLLDTLKARGNVLTALATHQATLEDVFVAMTGRKLREE
jgi:ABC-2 type transport system ATP-binding protein